MRFLCDPGGVMIEAFELSDGVSGLGDWVRGVRVVGRRRRRWRS